MHGAAGRWQPGGAAVRRADGRYRPAGPDGTAGGPGGAAGRGGGRPGRPSGAAAARGGSVRRGGPAGRDVARRPAVAVCPRRADGAATDLGWVVAGVRLGGAGPVRTRETPEDADLR